MDTQTFLQTHRVFNLDEAVQALASAGGRSGTLERLKYFVQRGKVKRLGRGVYASVPPGIELEKFRPDPYLSMIAFRPDALFSHHSALELLGAAHSEWGLCTAYTQRRRPPLDLSGVELRFLSNPVPLVRNDKINLGTRKVHRLDRELCLTGPERTLVEGFRQPSLAGGLSELVESAAGFPVLDFSLLLEVMESYREKVLWAAVGWFLETYRDTFYVDEGSLTAIESRRPKSPQYLQARQRGGVFIQRWNLVVPRLLVHGGEPDATEPRSTRSAGN